MNYSKSVNSKNKPLNNLKIKGGIYEETGLKQKVPQ